MELLLARTSREAHVHMELRPCRCGDATRPADSAVLELADGLASRYSGECPSCGRYREFVYRLPAEPVVPARGTVAYGDGTPSELLDPGEWLWVADRWARSARSLGAVAHARAAVTEVLAFVPPGADAVPATAFRTERGRRAYAVEPGRFGRTRLTAYRAALSTRDS